MRRNLSFKNLVILCLASFIMTVPQVFAENTYDTESHTNTSINNCNSNSQKDEKFSKKTSPYLNNHPNHRSKSDYTISREKVVPPLKVIVKEINGEEEENRSAVIEFEGKEITVKKDQIVDGKFKVIDIYPDRMVVYSSQEQRRHTYKIITNNEADTSKGKLEPRPKTTNPIKKPEPSNPIPPLKVTVKDIVGDEGNRYAVIEFENEEIKVVNKQVVKGKFKVVDIFPDRLVVYSIEEQRRRTYKIKN